jgi:hypothetical protein
MNTVYKLGANATVKIQVILFLHRGKINQINLNEKKFIDRYFKNNNGFFNNLFAWKFSY